MNIDVLTLFPEMFEGVFKSSILGKAQEKRLIQLNPVNFRQYANNKHNTVDDYPYGGGVGMVLKAEPIFSAVEDLITDQHTDDSDEKPVPRIILMCPQGERFSQKKAEELSQEDHLIFICGHYEGYDERIREHLITDEISIGDYVLTGGEIPAMAVIDSVVRLLPGVLGNENSAGADSFQAGRLEYPHYTRPAVFRDMQVPDVLLSGHHENISIWRKQQALTRTLQRRPDLLDGYPLSDEEQKMIKKTQKNNE